MVDWTGGITNNLANMRSNRRQSTRTLAIVSESCRVTRLVAHWPVQLLALKVKPLEVCHKSSRLSSYLLYVRICETGLCLC